MRRVSQLRDDVVGLDVEVEVDGATNAGAVEADEAAQLDGSGEDEVAGEREGGEVVLRGELGVLEGGMFLAEGELDGGERGLEDGEGCRLGEVAEYALVGHVDGDHGHRFLPTAAFLGAG